MVADTLWQDVVYTTRLLRKSPAFTAAALLTLALGVGVNTAVFSVLNALILRPLPVRDADRLIVIASQRSMGRALGGVSYPDLQDYREATSEIFEDLAGYSVGFLGLTPEGGRPERVLVTWVTGDYFPLLGIQPALGRLIRADEGVADAVVVLGFSTWQRRFGGDPAVIGRVTRVNGRPHTIVGVAPADFVGTFAFSESELYLPLGGLEARQARGLHALARLRPGVTLEEAQGAMNVVAERLARQYPETNNDVTVEVVPERLARPEEDAARSNGLVAKVMLALVGLVLLVAAVNVTNLLLARESRRAKELAIRAALGAGRGRLVRQRVTESLILAALGGSAGVLLGTWTGRVLTRVRLPGDLPVRFDFPFDWRVLIYAVMVMLVTGLVVGLVPALRASRLDPDKTLREASRAFTGRQGVGRVLVAAEVAAALVLFLAAGLFGRSLMQAESVNLGFQPEGILNLHMDVGQLGYTESRGRAFFDDVEKRVRAIPGVRDLSFAFTIPMGYVSVGETLDVEERVFALKNSVGPRYFATMGIPILRGRSFSDRDDEESHPVAIVNERLADLLWPGQDPIGRRFRSGPGGASLEVVGLTKTGKYRFLFENPQPYFYVPIAQQYTGLRVLQVLSSTSPDALAPVIERVIQEREPDLPLYDVASMTRALGGGYGFFLVRVGAFSAALFGILGLALAIVGVYGVVSYRASQRTHEIGVRAALGARPRDILRLVVGEGLGLVFFGLGAGLLVAVACTRFIGSFLFGVSARDPLTFAGVPPLLGLVALIACVIPAWRAAREDPTVTLRSE